jgi:hypothetical protein
MPRTRDEIVQNAVRGIHEVVVTHTKTKQGTIRTKEKLVPVVLPPKPERSGQSSKSKKKSPPHIQSEDVQGQQRTIPTTGGAEENPYLDDHELFLPEPTVEESQPRSTVCLDSMNIDTYADVAQTPMEQWTQFRSRYLHIILEMEAKPTFDTCSVCHNPASIKCPDCFGSPSFCRTCIPYAHRHAPFHRPLLWTATHYTQVSLQSLGFVLCLGHAGAPCPSTVEVCAYHHP